MLRESKRAVVAKLITMLVRINAWGTGETIFKFGALVKIGADPFSLYPSPIRNKFTAPLITLIMTAILIRFFLNINPDKPIIIRKIVVRKVGLIIFFFV